MTLDVQERAASRRFGGFPPLSPGAALFPLRLFLGVTFVYAGIQKLSDPGFLHPGAPTYIGTQLHGFANGTPGGFLLRAFALPQPKLTGVAIAVLEILVGLLVTTGLLTRAAASRATRRPPPRHTIRATIIMRRTRRRRMCRRAPCGSAPRRACRPGRARLTAIRRTAVPTS